MNKIIVSKDVLDLQDEKVILESLPNKLNLNIKGKVYCGIRNFNNKELTINLGVDSNLTLEVLITMRDSKNKITITNQNNSKIDMNYACTYKGNNELIIDSFVPTSDNTNNILVRAVEIDGTLTIKATGIIEENTVNNTYLEDIKAITNKCNSLKVMPDLIVKTNSVLANHNATISPVDKVSLFYLESKGLDRTHATSLIKEGFLKGIVLEEYLKLEEVNFNE